MKHLLITYFLSGVAAFAFVGSGSVSGQSVSGTVNLTSGPYAGCPGAGCAKGDYRSGTDGEVSDLSYVLQAASGNFGPSDVGKRGVAVDWHAANVRGSGPFGTCWNGYGCYSGQSCEFTVGAVNSSSSISVQPVAGCGKSGIINNRSTNGAEPFYWALYTDDSAALGNALSAAAGKTLVVPGNYVGGIFTGKQISANTTIACSTGATFYDPHFNGSTTFMFQAGSGSTMTGCTLSGTQNPNGPWYDVLREYNIPIGIFTSNFTFTHNTVKNVWGTYAVGTSGATNINISNNVFQSDGYYGVQLNQTGGNTRVANNRFTDSIEGSEDSSGVSGSPNRDQSITGNLVEVGPAGGVGYYRSQSAVGGFAAGSVWLSCGISGSGAAPSSQEYLGVSCTGNTITGNDSALYYNTAYGETESNNACTNGCTVK
jgi:Right handed beta helix region